MFRTLALLALVACAAPARADTELAQKLRNLDVSVIVRGPVRQQPLASMIARQVSAQLHAAGRAERAAWEKVQNRAAWEEFREARIKALRASLGSFPPVPRDLKVQRTGSHKGDGFQVDNLVFESRPGLLVTANLYRPLQPKESLPGIIICTSHHQPKNVGARQDMGMTWARAGCLVLIPDHLGHGERRQHPFPESVPHDYQCRFDAGVQLSLVGESLMGWLVWDLMRGVDVLLAQPGIDPQRIVVISEPAGGGDVAAVAAALDPRITCAMINNFGGPEPETAYPLSPHAEESFDFTGSGSWESTRNLRLSARDGFLPWTIVAAIAPRRLIYYHEFYWDRDNDPVWRRLQRVYGFYNASDALAGAAGRGFVVGTPPQNTHWIAESRELLYPLLERWLRIPNPGREYSNPLAAADLLCLTPETHKASQPLHPLAATLGDGLASNARLQRPPLKQRQLLQQEWTRLLGGVAPGRTPVLNDPSDEPQRLDHVTVERLHLQTEAGIVVPVVLLVPQRKDARAPVVLGLAQEGKQEFLRRRAEPIASLLSAGIAVCLPDVRGTGETAPGDGRDRRGTATSVSASELMLGQSLLGGRLRDLRSVLVYFRGRSDLDARRIGLWGDSFAAVNAADCNLQVPHNADKRPALAEPLGGLLALLGGLFEDDVRAIHVHGGLSDYRSVLESPFVYVPHDVIVPGVLAMGDLSDVAAALAPRPLWLESMVDGGNREVSSNVLAQRYAITRASYDTQGVRDRLLLGIPAPNESVDEWFVRQLQAK